MVNAVLMLVEMAGLIEHSCALAIKGVVKGGHFGIEECV